MTLKLLPDVELICVDYLKTVAEIQSLTSGRVYTQLPAEPTFPLVVLHRVAGSPAIQGHLEAARIQFDCWGRKKIEARQLAATVQAAMFEAERATHPLGVVTAVQEALGPLWLPDPARPTARYLLDLVVYAHPLFP